ncbi:putative protein phosphatase 2C 23 [Acorus gramineus]|uniref:protein-serine/threonine phosphatase n=1 Tax=Acorus gramineus TaxID=55184 RepID=A0AAV9B2Z5_ACOGR|nr:putative protein phosphatase 2C 23 [Acorus gramineus]
MGNCLTHNHQHRRRFSAAAVTSDTLDEGLGHSFCYVRPDPLRLSSSSSSSKVHHSDDPTPPIPPPTTTTTFRSISGASVSANTATDPLSSAPPSDSLSASAIFNCSDSFSSVPLQPVPRFPSGPLSGPIDLRGFLSGPIERGFLSGPLDNNNPTNPRIFSGPIDPARPEIDRPFRRSFSSGGAALRRRSIVKGLKRVIVNTIHRSQNSIVAPIKASSVPSQTEAAAAVGVSGMIDGCDSLQWAQGKAGEDRVHVVLSEDHGWVFVGIYDGFNGPDAPDYLLSNLYSAVHSEVKGLLWDEPADPSDSPEMTQLSSRPAIADPPNTRRSRGRRPWGASKKWEESQKRWKCEWDKERLELDRRLSGNSGRSGSRSVNHYDVLKALSQALKKTEEAYLEIADQMVGENPELALMGSCVLVMLMKGDDLYLMNVGDSRAVLARRPEADLWGSIGKARQDLEQIDEESLHELEAFDDGALCLRAVQLTLDHSTCDEKEIHRIRREHPDDACAVVNDRVKGSLKVTRAFGAGFLKQKQSLKSNSSSRHHLKEILPNILSKKSFSVQQTKLVWTSMNCLRYHKAIDGDTMMMFRL